MTDLDLQKCIVGEIEGLIKDKCLQVAEDYDRIEDFKVYVQDKPYKSDYVSFEDPFAGEEPDKDIMVGSGDQENYIIVVLDDEDLEEGSDDWTVLVHIIVSIKLYERLHQGNLIIADIMNNIYMHLKKKYIIGERYTIEPKAKKRFNLECYPEYAEGDLLTWWKIKDIYTEGLEDFI